MRKSLASLLLIVAVLTQGGLATAQSHPAINFDADNLVSGWTIKSDEDSFWQPLQTQGWNFQLSEPAVLTHLAMYDYSGDGLQNAFRVGLWGTVAGDLITEGIVDGGEEATLVGSWRLADVQDVLLQPGRYTIGERLESEQNEEWLSSPYYSLCHQSGLGCDLLGDLPESIIEDQFYWKFFEEGDNSSLIPNDPRVTTYVSAPLTNGQAFASTENAGFSIPTLGYLVNGGFIGPNLFLAPVPEPTTGVLTAIALLCMAHPSRLTVVGD